MFAGFIRDGQNKMTATVFVATIWQRSNPYRNHLMEVS